MKMPRYKDFLSKNFKLIAASTLFILLISCTLSLLGTYFYVTKKESKNIAEKNIEGAYFKNKIINPENNMKNKELIPKETPTLNGQNSTQQTNNKSNIQLPSKCKKNAIFVENEETPIYSEPSVNASPIVDKKGNPRFIDPRYDLTIIETRNDWIKINSLTPNWPPEAIFKNVWIKKSNLAGFNIDEETNKCLYVDFGDWEEQAKSAIPQAKQAAYNILSNDPRCDRIVKGGFLGAGQRYYLTCYPSDGAKPYHYWFSLLNSAKIDTSNQRIDDDTATSECNISLEKVIKNSSLLEIYSDNPPEIEENHKLRIKTSTFEGIGPAWHITIYFTIDDGSEQIAYCYVGPSGKAEISMY